MRRYLTIHVRIHDGRYHGDADELPSPFRLFQALVAGAGISGPLDDVTKQALLWLEELPYAPIIASPHLARGQAVTMFMPNNDLDKFGGDVRYIAKTRGAKKVWRPRHFAASVPWLYAWPFANDLEEETHAATICTLAERLYQLGRGVDMAWAWGEVLSEAALEAQLVNYIGVVRRPSTGDGLPLACPNKGSLESLERRHRAPRFRTESGQRVFVQQPKPTHRQVSYESPPIRYVFELRTSADSEHRVTWPLEAASSLVVAARDAARARLSTAMPHKLHAVDRYLVGHKPDGSDAVPAESRVRIIAIPSIGMHYADRAIRRILVEVPGACPLQNEDVRWAFSGAELRDPGEVKDVLLSPTADDNMLRHYGVGAKARVFRSVTPVVLPEEDKRRRIEPTRKLVEAKSGLERALEQSRARAAVVQALRHAGVRTPAESIRLQREPFDGSGSRVEPFAKGTRFEKERLWHVEIAFGVPIEGPLLLGDGRFLGLGLMAPISERVPGIHAFAITDGLADRPDPHQLARALRRAVMARVQAAIGPNVPLAPYFTGHAEDGAPLRTAVCSHLTYAFDPVAHQLYVLAPHIVERRPAKHHEMEYLRTLDTALVGFTELRAGNMGVLSILPLPSFESMSTLRGSSRIWTSLTPYVVTRHAKRVSASAALSNDVLAECRRIELPLPRVEICSHHASSGVGLTGHLRLTFACAVAGPIILGRNRFLGGGLFKPERPTSCLQIDGTNSEYQPAIEV